MARLRHGANVLYTRARDRYRKLRMRRDVALLRIGSLPPLWRREVAIESPNTFFSRAARRAVRGHVQRAAHREPALRPRLADSRLKGIRAWEYGTLLGLLAGQPGSGQWEALDVGAGKSAFPGYLLREGGVGRMTTLDLPESYETDSNEARFGQGLSGAAGGAGLTHVAGSMLEMPFADASFDLVTCISAIEHLDGDRLAAKHGREGGERLPYAEYLRDTRRAMAEMARVLRPGGHLYLTTDAFFEEMQKTDVWSSPHGRWPIWSVYRIEEVESLFAEPLLERGFELVGGHDYRPALLLDDPRRATYRGRYFTTLALWARKPPAPPPSWPPRAP